MRHTFEYEEYGSLLTLRGSFNVHEIIHLHENIYSHPNIDKSCYFIVDATDALVGKETLDVPLVVPESDRAFASYKPEMHALFISTNSEFINLYRQYKDHLDDTGWTFNLFDTLDEARIYQKSVFSIKRQEKA